MKAIDLGLLGEVYTQDSLGKGPYATPIRVQSPQGPELPALFLEPGGLQDKVYSNINILHLFSVLSDIPVPIALPLLCVSREVGEKEPSRTLELKKNKNRNENSIANEIIFKQSQRQ